MWVCAGEYKGSKSAKAFSRYAVSRSKKYAKEESYRAYITDAAKLLTETVAKFAGGPYLSERYTDILNPQKDERTGAEIASYVIRKAGLTIV